MEWIVAETLGKLLPLPLEVIKTVQQMQPELHRSCLDGYVHGLRPHRSTFLVVLQYLLDACRTPNGKLTTGKLITMGFSSAIAAVIRWVPGRMLLAQSAAWVLRVAPRAPRALVNIGAPVFAFLVVYPLDTAQHLLMLDIHGVYGGSMIRCLRHFVHAHGFLALYDGAVAGIIGFAIFRTVSSFLIQILNRSRYAPRIRRLLGVELPVILISTAAVLVVYPFDTIRVRMMISPLKYESWIHCLLVLLQEDGWRSLWYGALTNSVRGLLAQAVAHATKYVYSRYVS